MTEVGEWGFGSAIYIKNLHLPKALKYIGKSAFQSILAPVIELPDGLEEIDDFGFTNCPYVEELVFPEGIKRIGQWAFQQCMSLRSISLPSSLETFGKAAFVSCSKLEEIVVPDNVKAIPEQCFYNSRSARRIVIGKSVDVIGPEAFGYYDNGYNDPVVEEVYCLTDRRPSQTASDAFGQKTLDQATLFIKAGNKRSFKSTAPWSGFKDIVEVDDEGNGIAQHPTFNTQHPKAYTLDGRAVSQPSLPAFIIKDGKKYLNKE